MLLRANGLRIGPLRPTTASARHIHGLAAAVVLELPLARNTALAEIGQLKIELYAPSTDCNTLVRKSEDDPIDPVATQVWDLTPDERRAGADRYWDNLQPSPEGSTWNILIQAYGEEELRVGYACHSKELLAGQSIAHMLSGVLVTRCTMRQQSG